MRLSKYLFGILALFIVIITALVSIAFYSGNGGFYIIAVWVTALTLIMSTVAIVRAYQRVLIRMGTANERLAELKFLQERRYQQLSQRLDYTNDYLRLLKTLLQKSDGRPSKSSHLASGSSSGLEEVTARLQRAERRILGKLEDELYANHRLSKQVDEIASEVRHRNSN